jgi:hypothetical protein
VWQELRQNVHPRGCELVTVALDATGGERSAKFLDRASPGHPALIDRHHVSARLFGFSNIPSSVWIDEQGTLVRPAEVAPRPPGNPLPEPGPMPVGAPERMRRIADETTRINRDGDRYHAALADWIDKGENSRYAMTPEEVVERSTPKDAGSAIGEAHFELATYLEGLGDHERAIYHFRVAHRLTPGNWLFRRQAWSLEPAPNRFWQGPAPDEPDTWPYEGDWLTDIRKEGAENYYEPFRP